VNFFATSLLDTATNTLSSPRLVIGGATAAISLLPKTSAFLSSAPLSSPSFAQTAAQILTNEIASLSLPAAALVSDDYLLSAARGCLVKFLLHASDPSSSGADESLPRSLSSGIQSFPVDPDTLPVTAPVPKIGARLQASGEAM
jgi:hypothetical protein